MWLIKNLDSLFLKNYIIKIVLFYYFELYNLFLISYYKTENCSEYISILIKILRVISNQVFKV